MLMFKWSSHLSQSQHFCIARSLALSKPTNQTMNAIGFLLLLLILLLLPLHSCSSSVTQFFEAWCNKHGKIYSSEEEKLRRLEIFEDNYDFVKQHNAIGNSSYSLSLNAFADLTHREFKASHLGLAAAITSSARRNVGESGEVVRDIPASIDWSQEGAVTGVKDQGSCEGITLAIFDELKRRYVTIDGYTDVPENNETLLQQAVAAQPVSVGICASDRAFQFYHWVGPNCQLQC
ncbi:hypothetical protein Dsin_003578 [Dipteronia sinensis]|uniref:Cathepsin propeptide inhibitor domain-containing protein n=1 Tax=Dipteronia sinensis TaxID=43782 RepID=A0AAE0EL27_9ROSI|nr:hypothetical protein Dsin_003578 [Dipteronia sinensis]